MDYVAAAICNVWERRNKITRGLTIKWKAPIMRHLTVELDLLTWHKKPIFATGITAPL